MTEATLKPWRGPARLLRMTEVLELIPLSRSHLYRMIADGHFPKQVQLGARSVAWLESEIHQWMDVRIKQRNLEDMKDGQGIELESESNGYAARQGIV